MRATALPRMRPAAAVHRRARRSVRRFATIAARLHAANDPAADPAHGPRQPARPLPSPAADDDGRSRRARVVPRRHRSRRSRTPSSRLRQPPDRASLQPCAHAAPAARDRWRRRRRSSARRARLPASGALQRDRPASTRSGRSRRASGRRSRHCAPTPAAPRAGRTSTRQSPRRRDRPGHRSCGASDALANHRSS